MMNPHREKWDDVNAYRLYLGKSSLTLKLIRDLSQSRSYRFSTWASGPVKPSQAPRQASKDLNVMQTVFVAERNRREFRNRCGVA